MEPPADSVIEELRPAIKRAWETLLRAAPAVSPLASPDLMVYYMDGIIDRLVASLAAQPPAADAVTACAGFEQNRCACRLNPLGVYFITGEQALIEAAATHAGVRLSGILAAYHGVAQHEIENFCGVCAYRTSAECHRRPEMEGIVPTATEGSRRK